MEISLDTKSCFEGVEGQNCHQRPESLALASNMLLVRILVTTDNTGKQD